MELNVAMLHLLAPGSIAISVLCAFRCIWVNVHSAAEAAADDSATRWWH